MTTNKYDRAFFQTQSRGASRVREIVQFINALLSPKSIVDVGCGVGGWLAVFAEECQTEDILGLDGNYVDLSLLLIPEHRFLECDLSKGIPPVQRQFDLVVSLEVAEHLPAQVAEKFVRSLVSLGKIVLFSAAIPGQGGTNHINEQWPEYWQDLFRENNYRLVDCLRHRFWHNQVVPACYRQNMVLYIESDVLDASPVLKTEHDKVSCFPLSVVHPDFYKAAKQTPTLRPLLNALPQAFVRAIRNRVRRWRIHEQTDQPE